MKTVKNVSKKIGFVFLVLSGLYLTAADWPEYFRADPAQTSITANKS